jgi:hypothetical protein
LSLLEGKREGEREQEEHVSKHETNAGSLEYRKNWLGAKERCARASERMKWRVRDEQSNRTQRMSQEEMLPSDSTLRDQGLDNLYRE